MGFFSFLGLKKFGSSSGHGPSTSGGKSLPLSLFPGGEYTAPVGQWVNSIQTLTESYECRLRKIVHCKTMSGSRHEFLLVYIRHPSGKEAIVLADRDSASDASPVRSDDTKHSQDGKQAYATPTSRDRVKLSYDGTAQCLTRHISSWAEIHTVKFSKPSGAPSVAHLAALLTTLNRHTLSLGSSPEQRSSWFAYSVAEVLREIFGGEVKTSKKWVRVPYGGIAVENQDTVDALVREYTSTWEVFSRQLGQKGSTRTNKAQKSKTARQEQKKAKKKEQMNSFADMLRTMDT
ncbi:hypothetical protein HYDPIDRAFT_88354 [Hydnomerulius pinastri MD-312]|nr:hypothetical protein HYDPIDRAFT_88354 [Hydnomerulius pinastri MD-312]